MTNKAKKLILVAGALLSTSNAFAWDNPKDVFMKFFKGPFSTLNNGDLQPVRFGQMKVEVIKFFYTRDGDSYQVHSEQVCLTTGKVAIFDFRNMQGAVDLSQATVRCPTQLKNIGSATVSVSGFSGLMQVVPFSDAPGEDMKLLGADFAVTSDTGAVVDSSHSAFDIFLSNDINLKSGFFRLSEPHKKKSSSSTGSSSSGDSSDLDPEESFSVSVQLNDL